jgi:hypothetical protein
VSDRLHGHYPESAILSGLATMRPEPERPGRFVLETALACWHDLWLQLLREGMFFRILLSVIEGSA